VTEVEAFLIMIATERKASASTHNQALGVFVFLYSEVPNIDWPWLSCIWRPQQTKRIPSVLTKDEVAGLLAQMYGITALLAKLLYGTGTGMRLIEGIRLRIKDVDFDRHIIIIVREAKGGRWQGSRGHAAAFAGTDLAFANANGAGAVGGRPLEIYRHVSNQLPHIFNDWYRAGMLVV
jgi:integrase